MKLYDFLSLPDLLQYQSIWELGVHIDSILYNRVSYQLYAINDFYVEVHYNAADNKILGKLAFKGGEALDKYLEKLTTE
jgi:hypothetical protein